MIDFFIVNVALPTIDSDLRASQPLLELVVSGYATAYALLLVLGGRLGDSIRPQAAVPAGHGRVHRHLAGLRAGPDGYIPGGRPGRAGRRRRR